MTIQQSLNRGFNLMTTSILGLSAFAFLPEVFLEDEWAYKADDLAIFFIGLIAIGWYLKGGNHLKRSNIPVVLMVLALLSKILGLVIEFKDKTDVGDDFGALILFAIATGLVFYQYYKTKQLADAAH